MNSNQPKKKRRPKNPYTKQLTEEEFYEMDLARRVQEEQEQHRQEQSELFRNLPLEQLPSPSPNVTRYRLPYQRVMSVVGKDLRIIYPESLLDSTPATSAMPPSGSDTPTTSPPSGSLSLPNPEVVKLVGEAMILYVKSGILDFRALVLAIKEDTGDALLRPLAGQIRDAWDALREYPKYQHLSPSSDVAEILDSQEEFSDEPAEEEQPSEEPVPKTVDGGVVSRDGPGAEGAGGAAAGPAGAGASVPQPAAGTTPVAKPERDQASPPVPEGDVAGGERSADHLPGINVRLDPAEIGKATERATTPPPSGSFSAPNPEAVVLVARAMKRHIKSGILDFRACVLAAKEDVGEDLVRQLADQMREAWDAVREHPKYQHLLPSSDVVEILDSQEEIASDEQQPTD